MQTSQKSLCWEHNESSSLSPHTISVTSRISSRRVFLSLRHRSFLISAIFFSSCASSIRILFVLRFPIHSNPDLPLVSIKTTCSSKYSCESKQAIFTSLFRHHPRCRTSILFWSTIIISPIGTTVVGVCVGLYLIDQLVGWWDVRVLSRPRFFMRGGRHRFCQLGRLETITTEAWHIESIVEG